MSGPVENMDIMWERIGKVLKIEDAGPMGLYLGCIHEEGSVKMEDGKTVRTMTFNQEGFFREKVEKYFELCLDKGGKEVKLATVTTPYVKETPKESCARKREK